MRYPRGKKGITFTGDLIEIVIFAGLVIIGLLLLILGAALKKGGAESSQNTQIRYITVVRAQIEELHSPFADGSDRTVADEIVLAQSSDDVKKELLRSRDVTVIANEENYGRLYLPTLDGKVMGVGGIYTSDVNTEAGIRGMRPAGGTSGQGSASSGTQGTIPSAGRGKS